MMSSNSNDKSGHLYHNVITLFFLAIISLSCVRELVLCIIQLINKHFTDVAYNCVGSFDNSGPLGGYYSICISLIIAYACVADCNRLIKKVCFGLGYCFFVCLVITTSRAALLALSVGILSIAIANKKSRIMLLKYWKSIGLIVCCIAIGIFFIKRPSAEARLHIYHISMRIIASNTNGVGHGNFAGAFGKEQAVYFGDCIRKNGQDPLDWTAINSRERLIADCPNVAFNEYLQIGVENGILYSLLLVFLLGYVYYVSYNNGTIWCHGIASFACFATFSYPFQCRQFQLLLLLLFFATFLQQIFSARSFFRFCVPIIIMAIMLDVNQYDFHLAQRKAVPNWETCLKWYQLGYYAYFVEDCDSLSSLYWDQMCDDYRLLFAYGHSLNKVGDYEKSDYILKKGAEISSDPMFWNVMGNNSLALKKYEEAEERYLHAFYMVPNRIYPLTLLAKLYDAESDTIRFLKVAEMVETFIPKIESVNTENLKEEISVIKSRYYLE